MVLGDEVSQRRGPKERALPPTGWMRGFHLGLLLGVRESTSAPLSADVVCAVLRVSAVRVAASGTATTVGPALELF